MTAPGRAAALAALLLPFPGVTDGGLAAQARSSAPPLGPELHASASVLTPLSELSSTAESFATELSTSVGASAGGVWWLGRHVGIGVHGVWEPAELNLRPAAFTGVVPDDLGDADYTAAFGQVVFRLPLEGPASVVEPFLAVGGGVRDLRLDPIATPEARSATDPAATAAAGAAVRLWDPLALRLEVRDVLSDYDETVGAGGLQNDVLVSVGLSFRP